MITERQAAPPAADISALASWLLTERQLGDLELILSGAFAPLAGFMTSADAAAVAASCCLTDGTSFPVPVTLEVPASAVAEDARQLLLTDSEGTPLAILEITERDPQPPGSVQPGSVQPGSVQPGSVQPGSVQPGSVQPGMVRLAGPVTAVRAPEHGSFRRMMLSPAEVRALLGDVPVLAYPTRGPLHGHQIGQLRHLAGQLKARLLLLPLVVGQAEVIGRPEPLVRAVLAAAPSLPSGTLVVPVPLAVRGAASSPDPAGPAREVAARAFVAAAYGATHVMADAHGAAAAAAAHGLLPGAPIPVLPPADWAYDPQAEVWRPLSLIEAGTERADLSADQLGDLLDAGAEIPSWFTPPAVARELRRARRPRSERGFVLFLTGLSGSGKSTIARDLRDVLSERGDRRVSLLDGDQVRRLLSAGLTFSRADRDLNIARIGFVAAEIARHGGIAICAPIAPFAAARAQVREMVSEAGDFFLIHIATPVEVCEARDRKGLYAKARAGLISQFTGVTDPYEEPADAELTLDTSVLDRQESVDRIVALLTSGGWLAADRA